MPDTVQRFGDHFIEYGYDIMNNNVDCGDDRSDITLADMTNDAAFSGIPLVYFDSVSALDIERLVAPISVDSCQ